MGDMVGGDGPGLSLDPDKKGSNRSTARLRDCRARLYHWQTINGNLTLCVSFPVSLPLSFSTHGPQAQDQMAAQCGLTSQQRPCAAASVSRLRETNAPSAVCAQQSPTPGNTTALPGNGRQRASAGPHMCVPSLTRHNSCKTCTPSASRATRRPSPATADGGPEPGHTCVCRHRRAAIAARPARLVPLARRDHPPRPRPAGGPATGRTCVCRHQRVAITARPAHPVCLT